MGDYMNSRMDKYQQDFGGNVAVKNRTNKNRHLYEEIQNMNIDYINIDVNDAKIITSDSLNKRTRADYQKVKHLEAILPQEKKEIQKVERLKKEDRVYDINEILRLAKNNKLFEDDNKKRLINTEYNILTKLDIEKINEHEDMSKEGLKRLINQIYENEEKEIDKPYTKYEEKELLSELMMGDDSLEEVVIDEEISKNILDKDVEEEDREEEIQDEDQGEKESVIDGEADLTETISDEELIIEEAKSKKMLVAVIIIVVLLLLVGAYLFFKYFGTL